MNIKLLVAFIQSLGITEDQVSQSTDTFFFDHFIIGELDKDQADFIEAYCRNNGFSCSMSPDPGNGEGAVMIVSTLSQENLETAMTIASCAHSNQPIKIDGEVMDAAEVVDVIVNPATN